VHVSYSHLWARGRVLSESEGSQGVDEKDMEWNKEGDGTDSKSQDKRIDEESHGAIDLAD